MRIAALFLLLGLGAGASDDDTRVYVGKLLAVSHDELRLGRNESVFLIGFTADQAALAGLDRVRVGEEVRVVFGGTPRPDGSGGVNKLLSVRRCVQDDAQCAADGKVQDAKKAEAEKALHALSDAKVAEKEE